MTRTVVTLSVLACLAGALHAQTSIAGDWDLTIESPQGANTVRVTFKQDGEKVSGLFKSDRGEMAFEGTLVGSDLKFGFTVDAQGQSLEIAFTGKVTGDAMEGRVQFGTFGDGGWTAKRGSFGR